MFFKLFSSLAFWAISLIIFAQDVEFPAQAETGPGGADYAHDSVIFQNYADEPDGYWLFEPAEPKPAEAPVVVFMHGYSAYNPMVFGGWISHLVRKGNIVVFPRYQKNLFTPSPDQFVSNTATAIKNALKELESGDHVRPSDAPVCMVGHSFGGAIIANMSTEWEALGIPKPAGIMLVSPGTGPFRSFELPSYEKIPFDTKMLVVVSENDRVVGEDFGTLIFNTATKTPERNLLRQLEERHKNLSITAGHNEVYAVDKKFDNGIHGHSYRKAQFSVINPVDYNGYWKLFDAMMECTRCGNLCQVAFGGTHEQLSLGNYSDGKPLRLWEVTLPEASTASKAK